MSQLRDACAGDDPAVDVDQALRLLVASGLVAVEGDLSYAWSHTVPVHLVASVLNMALPPSDEPDAVERVVRVTAAALGPMRRFGRDFHDGNDGLLLEEVFSSMLAVVLAVAGLEKLKPRRESVQAAGYADLVVDLPDNAGHVVIEVKLWPRNDYTEIQRQVDDYWLADTRHAIAVMLGERGATGWENDYVQKCLPAGQFVQLPTPPDLVGRWRVERPGADGTLRRTDHLLVQIPKRR